MSYPGTWALSKPNHPAIIMAGSGEITTYDQLNRQSIALASALRDQGLRAGDTLAVLAENSPELLVAAWAAQRSGLYLTAISTHLSAQDAQYILRNSDAKVLVTTAQMLELSRAIDGPEVIARFVAHVAPADLLDGERNYGDVLKSFAADSLEDEAEGEILLYSSGTTGAPKAIRPPLVLGPMGTAVDGPSQWLLGLGATEDSVYLSPAPLYHTAPLAWCKSAHRLGLTVVVLESFSPEFALAAIESYGVTHSQWVPTMFVQMIKADPALRARYDLSTMVAAVHAAAPCPIEVKRAMIDWWGPILVEYYSSTERIGATLIDSAQWLANPGSVGRAILGVIHIVGDDGEELPAGQIGRVFFSGGPTFEYRGEPEKTAAAYDHRGWATVGDIGYVNDDGYLYLTDRADFMILCGGVNIYPQEIENVLIGHPSILDAAVIGLPHEILGQVPHAMVQLVAGAQLTSSEILAYLEGRFSGYKLPRSVEIVEELPRTPSGKLVKAALLAEHA